MERFAINILHQKIQNICRLCGVDNPIKLPIVEDDDIICLDDDEVTLVKKIEECVGIKVCKTDQMPQLICSLCIDKVNDFYEYRLMCAATNIQTRSILNLPRVEPTTVLVKAEPAPDPPPPEEETTASGDSKAGVKRGGKTRRRKNHNAVTDDLQGASTEKRIKTEYACQYCNEAYDTNGRLERHLVLKHTPLIRKYGCGTCAELFDTVVEYKNHHEWHKKTRTAYHCFRCKRKFVKMSTLSKHLQIKACVRSVRKPSSTTLVPDMQCKLCSKTFKTRNLYEWHGCFLRGRTNCPKCGKYFLKKNLLVRHYMLYCTGTIAPMEPVLVKIEQETLEADGLPEPTAMSEKAEKPAKRRGRPPLSARVEEMKEETTELPFPPLLDLPEMKLENTPSEEASSEANAVPGEDVEDDGRERLKASVEEAAEPNESPATESLTRKNKKHEDQASSNTAANEAYNPIESAVLSSMVVLSMAHFKPKACESPVVPAASEGNDLNSNATNSRKVHDNAGGNGEDAYDRDDDGFAGHDDTGSIDHMEGSGSDREMEESTPIGSVIQREHSSQTAPPAVRIKQEPMTDPRSSSVAENGGEYELAISCLAIKHEPVADEEEPSQERRVTRNTATVQALRMRIKKEKGLYNATMTDEAESDLVQAPLAPDASSEPEDCVSNHRKKPTKKANTPNHYKVSPPRSRPTPPPVEPNVRIKQERCDVEEDQQSEEPPENVVDQYGSAAIKQEPFDCLAGHSDPDRSVPIRSLEIAFDGVQIKQELQEKRPRAIWPTATDTDVTNELQNADGNSHPALRQADSPLIGTFNNADSSRSQAGKSKKASSGSSKSSKRINPFALLRRKALAASNARETIPDARSEPSAERVSLPVIAQVTSVNPEEHLAEAEGSSPCEEEVDNSDDGTVQSTDLERGTDAPATAQATPDDREEHFAEAVASAPCEEQGTNNGDGVAQTENVEPDRDVPKPSSVPVVLAKADAEQSTESASAETVIVQPASEVTVAFVSTVQTMLMLGDEIDCAVQEKIAFDTGLDPDPVENSISAKDKDSAKNIGDNDSTECHSGATDISSVESSKCSTDNMWTFGTEPVLREKSNEEEHSVEGKSNISVQLAAKPNELVKKSVGEVENDAQKESTEEDVISPNKFELDKGTSKVLACEVQTPKMLTAQTPEKAAEVAEERVEDVDNETAKGGSTGEAMDYANDDIENDGTSKMLATKEDVPANEVNENVMQGVDDNDATKKITEKMICSNDVMEAEGPTEAPTGEKSSSKGTTVEGTSEIAEKCIPEVDTDPIKEPTGKEMIVSNGVLDDEGISKEPSEEMVSKVSTSEEQRSTSVENENTSCPSVFNEN